MFCLFIPPYCLYHSTTPHLLLQYYISTLVSYLGLFILFLEQYCPGAGNIEMFKKYCAQPEQARELPHSTGLVLCLHGHERGKKAPLNITITCSAMSLILLLLSHSTTIFCSYSWHAYVLILNNHHLLLIINNIIRIGSSSL